MENEFQLRLRQAIADKHITASELSRLSGVGKSDISNYLNGKYLPKQDKIFLLSQALGVDPDWLMTGKVPEPDRTRVPVVVPDSKQFVKIAQALSAEDYETVMRIFEKTFQKLKEKGEI